jgi:hypothetical protein
VALDQVDVVRAKPAQRVLDALDDVLAREPAVVRALRHREEALGGDHHIAARDVSQRVAERLLARAVRVHVGGVEQVHAEVERAVHDLARAGPVDARAKREPRAHRHLAHLEATAP